MIEWEKFCKQARKIENEVDQKLISLTKLGSAAVNTCMHNDEEPLLSPERILNSITVDVGEQLSKLRAVNEKLEELVSSEQDDYNSASKLHTLQRHKDILQDFTKEFHKTQQNYRTRKERETLLHHKKAIDSCKSSVGLDQRLDLHAEHIMKSNCMLDDQISIVVEIRENLVSQRLTMKRIQTRIHDLSSRFPVINSLIQWANIRKRRDSVILGLVIGLCTFLLLLYIFCKS